MSLLLPEIATRFGAVDSAALVDGGVSDAHVLRELARSANRLACTGEPLLRFAWDASTDNLDDNATGQCLAYGEPFWFQLTPLITRPKHPGLSRGKLFVYFQARTGEVLHLQVHSGAAPFSRLAHDDAPNVLTLTGTGADAWAELDDVPIAAGDVDYLSLWLRGTPTKTAGDTGTYGTPNAGTITAIPAPNILEDNGASWNHDATTWATGGHCVVVHDGLGRPLTAPRSITTVIGDDWLQVYPPFDPGWSTSSLVGAAYSIFEIPRVRIYSAMLYAKDRSG